MCHRFFGRADTSGRFVTLDLACLFFPRLDSLAHDECGFGSSVDTDFAGRSLDEVRTGSHSEDRGFPDVLGGFQRTGLQNNLEVCVFGSSFLFADLVEAFLVLALKELALRERHVALGSTFFDSHSRLCDFDLDERLCSRETAYNGGYANAFCLEVSLNNRNESRINANAGYVIVFEFGEVFAEIVDTSSHFLHTCVGVVAHQRGEVDLV